MNVRLQYGMTWRSGIWFENQLQMNHYQIELNMITNTGDPQDQINCMNRINYFVYEELGNTVFVNENNFEQIQLLNSAGIKLTTLPEEPIDQVIGWIVFLKLNAILEDRMIVTDISIQSDLGDNIKYLHSQGESLGPLNLNGWWADPSPIHSALIPSNKKRIVKLNKSTTWKKLGMHWSDQSQDSEQTANTVVFAQFAKDES